MNPFGQLPILELDDKNPRLCGQMHGDRLKKNIQKMADLRLAMMLKDTDFSSEGEVLALAREHLPLLENFDIDLYDELLGIADGARVSPELVVVINHYTDMRDLRKNREPNDLGGCSVIFSPAKEGHLLGQTWDVHGSATEHVCILKFPNQMVFSVAGCLGMTGLNRFGVGVTINNLCSLDAQVGIVWPALVRKILKNETACQGYETVMKAKLGSGHHYVIADQDALFAIETSATKKKVTQSDPSKTHIHTNHCLDPEMRETHTIRDKSTTYERFETLEKILEDTSLESLNDIYEAFGRVSFPVNQESIHNTATCGSFVMNLTSKTALASKGPPSKKYFDNSPVLLNL